MTHYAFLVMLKKTDCGYLLELSQKGSSDEHPRSVWNKHLAVSNAYSVSLADHMYSSTASL